MAEVVVTVEDAPGIGERAALEGFLRVQRELVMWKLQDADDGVLRTVATPSGLAPLGVLRHLTAVERWWVRHQFAGEPDLQWDWTDEDPDGEYRIRDGETVTSLIGDYQAEIVACNDAIAGRSLDEVGANSKATLRWVLFHMIEETARHLGHLDLLRENADGSVGCDPQVRDDDVAGAP